MTNFVCTLEEKRIWGGYVPNVLIEVTLEEVGDGWKGREEVGTLIFPHAVLLEKHFKQAGVTEMSQEDCINEIRKGHLAIQHT